MELRFPEEVWATREDRLRCTSGERSNEESFARICQPASLALVFFNTATMAQAPAFLSGPVRGSFRNAAGGSAHP